MVYRKCSDFKKYSGFPKNIPVFKTCLNYGFPKYYDFLKYSGFPKICRFSKMVGFSKICLKYGFSKISRFLKCSGVPKKYFGFPKITSYGYTKLPIPGFRKKYVTSYGFPILKCSGVPTSFPAFRKLRVLDTQNYAFRFSEKICYGYTKLPIIYI